MCLVCADKQHPFLCLFFLPASKPRINKQKQNAKPTAHLNDSQLHLSHHLPATPLQPSAFAVRISSSLLLSLLAQVCTHPLSQLQEGVCWPQPWCVAKGTARLWEAGRLCTVHLGCLPPAPYRLTGLSPLAFSSSS